MMWIYPQRLARSRSHKRIWIDVQGLALTGWGVLRQNWLLLLTLLVSGGVHAAILAAPTLDNYQAPELPEPEPEELEEVNITSLVAQPPKQQKPKPPKVETAPPKPKPPPPKRQFDPARDNPLLFQESQDSPETEATPGESTPAEAQPQDYQDYEPPVTQGTVPGDDLLSKLRIAIVRELGQDPGVNDPAQVEALFDIFPQEPPPSFNYFASGNRLQPGAVGFLYISQDGPDNVYFKYLKPALADLGLEVVNEYYGGDAGSYGGENFYEVTNPNPQVELTFYVSLVGTSLIGPSPTRSFLVIWANDPRG